MNIYLKSCLHRILGAGARVLTGIASRFGPCAQTSTSPPPFASIDPSEFPPFGGSAEEALLLWQLPPATILKTKILATIDAKSRIPDTLEVVRLTGAGKVMARGEFIFIDDFGARGRPDQLPGRCIFCGRVSFKAASCEICGRLACPECGAQFEDKAAGRNIHLCIAHHRAAVWHRDLWAEDRPRHKQLHSTNEREETPPNTI